MPEIAKFRFGHFELDTARYELLRKGRRIKLERIPMDLLLLLLERSGTIVSRDEIADRLWGKGTFVDTENNINAAVRKIRQALRDRPERPTFLQTITGRGYRFISPVASSQSDSSAALSFRPIGSIAVLPLENLSGNPDYEYFSDGMTDLLIGEIARISSLRVTSRTSIIKYKVPARTSLPTVARELNVDAIVEGTVSHFGSIVRINAQLIRAQDDSHLWAESYERELTDILALQSEVARTIAQQIRVKLTPAENRALTRNRQVNPLAYDAFLKGNFFLHKTMPGVARSIQFFQEAIQHDAVYPDAHAGLASALCYSGIFGLRPSAETYAEARVSALRALELDETNASAHNALADVKKGLDWNMAGAVMEYQQALLCNPSHLLTHLWYAECLTRLNQYDEALTLSGRALALDPVSPTSYNNRAMLFFRARRYDEAIQASEQALELDSSFVNALWWKGVAYAGNRSFSAAITCLTKAIAINDGPLLKALLGYVYGCAGHRTEALAILEEITILSRQRYVSPINFAVVYSGLDDADSTFEWLEAGYRDRATRIHELSSMYFDNLREDPRCANLLSRIGLPTSDSNR
jgi:TolB-like protein